MLCEVCSNIDFDTGLLSRWAGETLEHHANYAALLEATKHGCEFCKLIREKIGNDLPDKWRRVRIYLQTSKDSYDKNAYLNVLLRDILLQNELWGTGLNFSDKGKETELLIAAFRIFTKRTVKELQTGEIDPDNFFAEAIGGRETNSSTDSDETFRLANIWLNRCIGGAGGIGNGHDFCHFGKPFADVVLKRDEDGSWAFSGHVAMPSRTIDVGPGDGSRQPFLAIHGQSGVSQPWAALSHCWGTSSPLCTTMGNLEDRKRAIPMEGLPATFRDAVTITRRLGIRHLWIDSLCIIQDSGTDWSAESLKMAGIYQNSLINIAPSAVRGCCDGIFNRRKKNSQAFELPVDSKRYGRGSLFLEDRVSAWLRDIIYGGESVLSTRAWVLQETLMSPRTLHYGKDQIYWECREAVYSEGVLPPLPRKVAQQNYTYHDLSSLLFSESYWEKNKEFILPPPKRGVAGYEDENIAKRIVYKRWYEIVEKYTCRKLTCPLDIFPALSGLASIFQSLLGDRYIAGIFDGDLPCGLLWQSCSSKTRAADYRAPSWSWASLEHTQVRWDYNLITSNTVGEELNLALPTLLKDGFRQREYFAAEIRKANAQEFARICGELNLAGPMPPTILHVEITPAASVENAYGLEFGHIPNGHLILRTLWHKATCVDFAFDNFADKQYIEGEINLDASDYENFESLQGEFGEIQLVYMGIWDECMFALMLAVADAARDETKRIGLFRRSATWFLERARGWEMKTVRII